jgi:hypothetical protein
MPTVARLANCTLNMYAGDHLPPHFHVRLGDGREALVEIGSLGVLRGSITKRELATVMAWAAANRAVLVAKWKELNP